jgi:hypothetical protein
MISGSYLPVSDYQSIPSPTLSHSSAWQWPGLSPVGHESLPEAGPGATDSESEQMLSYLARGPGQILARGPPY